MGGGWGDLETVNGRMGKNGEEVIVGLKRMGGWRKCHGAGLCGKSVGSE